MFYLLLSKLLSVRDAERSELDPSHHDVEDVVALFVEIFDLPASVESAGLTSEVREGLLSTFAALDVRDIRDLVEMHVHAEDWSEVDRVVAQIETLRRP